MTGEGSPVEQTPTIDMYTQATGAVEEAAVHTLAAPRAIPGYVVDQVRSILSPDFAVSVSYNHHKDAALNIHPPVPLERALSVGNAIAWMMGVEAGSRIIDVSGTVRTQLARHENGTWHREPL